MPVPFVLLACAVLAVWLPALRLRGQAVPPWPLVYAAAVASAWSVGVVTAPALAAIGVLAALTWASLQAPQARVRTVCTVLVAVTAVAFMLHLLPGFRNPKLFVGVQIGVDTPPISPSLNFDKASAGLFLLAAYAPRLSGLPDLRRVAPAMLGITAATVVVMLGTAMALGYVRPDFKLPGVALGWLVSMLLFTCVSEEALFRGLLQDRLARGVQGRPQWRWLPVVVSSVLFGLVHTGGGAGLMLIVTLAGLGYSLAYATTGRIEAAVLAHFGVNGVHFIGFSYPHLLV